MCAAHPEAVGTALIARHTLGLAELGREHDAATPVPTCGDWNLADLVWHLAEVHDFWCHIIGNRPAGPESYDPPGRPVDTALPDLLCENCDRLTRLLTSAEPSDQAWSWADDHTVGFTLRRQTHEALVHHVDGVLAVGTDLPYVEPLLAADGVDELVTEMLTGVPDWATYEPDRDTVLLIATDTGDRWPMRFGRMTGTSPDTATAYDLEALELLAELAAPTTAISAPAVDLDLWAWGRGDDARVTIDGDVDGARRLRAVTAESTA